MSSFVFHWLLSRWWVLFASSASVLLSCGTQPDVSTESSADTSDENSVKLKGIQKAFEEVTTKCPAYKGLAASSSFMRDSHLVSEGSFFSPCVQPELTLPGFALGLSDTKSYETSRFPAKKGREELCGSSVKDGELVFDTLGLQTVALANVLLLAGRATLNAVPTMKVPSLMEIRAIEVQLAKLTCDAIPWAPSSGRRLMRYRLSKNFVDFGKVNMLFTASEDEFLDVYESFAIFVADAETSAPSVRWAPIARILEGLKILMLSMELTRTDVRLTRQYMYTTSCDFALFWPDENPDYTAWMLAESLAWGLNIDPNWLTTMRDVETNTGVHIDPEWLVRHPVPNAGPNLPADATFGFALSVTGTWMPSQPPAGPPGMIGTLARVLDEVHIKDVPSTHHEGVCNENGSTNDAPMLYFIRRQLMRELERAPTHPHETMPREFWKCIQSVQGTRSLVPFNSPDF